MIFLRFFVLFVGLGLAIWAGLWVSKDPGYLLIAYQHWTIEMPLWLIGAAVLILGALLYSLRSIGCSIKQFFSSVHAQGVRRRRARGWLAFALEDWKQAERLLLKSAPHSECALPYYLAAAQAADARGHSQARDQYLQWAFECDASWEFPLRLIQAKLQLKRGELEACADNLFALSLQNPRHADVLRLRGEWQQLKLAHDVTA